MWLRHLNDDVIHYYVLINEAYFRIMDFGIRIVAIINTLKKNFSCVILSSLVISIIVIILLPLYFLLLLLFMITASICYDVIINIVWHK